jgi:hypothetical protein
MQCVRCEGHDTKCESCGGHGGIDIDDPAALLDEEVYDAIDAADLAKRGSWPVAGGWLDQSASLVRAVRRIWIEDRIFRAQLRIPADG